MSETVRTAVYDIPRRHGAFRPAADAVRSLRAAHARALADNLSGASEAAFREAVRSALEEDLLCEVTALFNDFARLPTADAKTLFTIEMLTDDEFALLGRELLDGRLIFNTRDGNKSEGAYFRYDAISEDGGETFLPSRKTSLVEPVNGCQGSMITYGKDESTGETILLFSNPNHTSSRRHGTVKASFDGGDSWTRMYQYVPSEGNDMYVSYSDMVIVGENTIGVIYEAGRKNNNGIVFQTVFFSDIKDSISYQ